MGGAGNMGMQAQPGGSGIMMSQVDPSCLMNDGRRPQFRLLAKYIHKTVRTDTDRARCDWLLLMIRY